MGDLMEGLIAGLGIVAGLMVTLTSLWWETPPMTQGEKEADYEARIIYPKDRQMAA